MAQELIAWREVRIVATGKKRPGKATGQGGPGNDRSFE
jgi:hypothetical protein